MDEESVSLRSSEGEKEQLRRELNYLKIKLMVLEGLIETAEERGIL